MARVDNITRGNVRFCSKLPLIAGIIVARISKSFAQGIAVIAARTLAVSRPVLEELVRCKNTVV